MKTKLALARQVQAALASRYPVAFSQLTYDNPWQLLVAVILSAQCTDARVNEITPELFKRWPGPAELARASREDLETVIHAAGFFRNKAKNLLACARMVSELHGGLPPKTLEELIKLPGVARKTANVVLFAAYGLNVGFAVDTHVNRISYRMGLSQNTDPVKVEQDLIALFPQTEWGNLNHRLVWFGRDVCRARKPDCDHCEFGQWCPRLEPPDKKRKGRELQDEHESPA